MHETGSETIICPLCSRREPHVRFVRWAALGQHISAVHAKYIGPTKVKMALVSSVLDLNSSNDT